MKNIYILPTDKPSSLCFRNYLFINRDNITEYSNVKFKNIYITSDEEIKYNDYYLGEDGLIYCLVTTVNSNGKKIILTTDKDLIKDGVQAIDDEFLEWFVKNPSCEKVEIENTCLEIRVCDCPMNENCLKPGYEIIIPKEEPKPEPNFYEKLKEYFENTPREKVLEDWNKSAHLDNVGPTIDEFIENSAEERLKDAAETRYGTDMDSIRGSNVYDLNANVKKGFIDGVKSDAARDYWYEKFQKEQENKMYSEEEVFELLKKFAPHIRYNHKELPHTWQQVVKEWFEQFKKQNNEQ
jgi:hypothetical protein